jgi:hypothetical protein
LVQVVAAGAERKKQPFGDLLIGQARRGPGQPGVGVLDRRGMGVLWREPVLQREQSNWTLRLIRPRQVPGCGDG